MRKVMLSAHNYICSLYHQPLSKSKKGLFITPDNIRHLADYLDNSVSISDKYIYFGTGSSNERLIEVPLLEPGEVDAQSSIRLTVAFDPDGVTSDSDIRVGVSDGTYYNQFYIYDTSASYACAPYGGSHEGNRVHQNYDTGEITLLFHPFHRYGACSTRHDGGYVNIARFSSQLDITKGLSLQVNRDTSSERYKIYYFIVEILS